MAEPEWTSIFQITARDLKDSWHLEFDESIVPNRQQPGWKKSIVYTSARFNCSECGRRWSSNKVMVVCNMRRAYGQGVVKLRPSRQNCKICSDAPMEKPSITSENIKPLLQNLVEKIRIKCYNEDLGRKKKPFRSFDAKSPHEPAHCEACMQGICPKTKLY
ncbi:receptor-transporting protein 3-like [Perca flavescens]|uniref:receptor-transporting protein 3-like n=1 Tax=Perca flavescens TaxID=8167 RepID=UPI00106EDC58|nr:receptor-transporting protein 3-like [Perca flavescens]